MLAAPAPLLAHAELAGSDPLPNASLVEGPDAVSMTFSEPIDPANASIRLLDAQLLPLDGLGAVIVDEAGTVARVDLPALEPGTYTVSYQVVSTVDGHATAGIFAFVVDPTGAQAPPARPPTSVSPSVDGWAVAARWLALLAAMVALGSLVTWWHAGRPTLEVEAPTADRRPPWRLVAGAGGASVIGLALYLALAARPIGATADGLPFDVVAPFGWTAFAIAMRVSLLSALAAALVALAMAHRRSRTDDRSLVALVGGLMAISLAGMSAAGHASSLGGPLNAAIDWLHLVAAAAWLGGLPAIHALATRVRAVGGSRRNVAGEMLRRHGRLALVAGPLVVLTGLANSPLVLGTPRELVASSYGNLLLVKALLVSVALAIGAANHFLLRGRGRGHVAALVAAELLVAAVAVMAGATMVTIQPGATRQPVLAGPSVHPAHFFGEAGLSSIHASVSVPAPGRQTYRVTIRDAAAGTPRTDVQKVFLTFTPPAESGLDAQRAELEPAEIDGLYAVTGAYTPLVGEWGLDVSVRREGARDESAPFELTVSEQSPPLIGPPPDTGVGVPAPLAVLWAVLPTGIAGWIPGLAAIAAFVAVGARWRRLVPLRAGLLLIAAVSVLAAGSRSVVEAANRPTTAELAVHTDAGKGSADAGEPIYLANCASCHGADGSGDGPTQTLPEADPLAESLPALSDAEVSYRIANGLAGTPMPPFAASLTEQELRDLVSYLRQRWGSP
ncbi:MAG TPA: copper resistance protein CopC [Candidatus Limnocylindrales bacterium]|nr:copper resistance protein CopC [Candidatus Limnocylindrales bacterium]